MGCCGSSNVGPPKDFDDIPQAAPTKTDVVGALVPNARRGAMLEKVPLLQKLSESERDKLGGLMIEKKFEKDAYVFKQGDPGKDFFIIVKGKAMCCYTDPETQRTTTVAELGDGDYFGEAALLHEDGRGADVKASASLTCLVLSKAKFDSLLGNKLLNVQFPNRRIAISAESAHNKGANKQTGKGFDLAIPPMGANRKKSSQLKLQLMQACTNNLLFIEMDARQQEQILESMYQISVPKGQAVIEQGEYGYNLFCVTQGSFNVYIDSEKDGKKSRVKVDRRDEGIFGELALMYNAPRSATIIANEDSTVWAVDRYTFRKVNMDLGETQREENLAFLQKIDLLAPLTTQEKSKIAEALEKTDFKRGQVIVQQNDPGDAMYLICTGEATVLKQEPGKEKAVEVKKLSAGEYFGERALMKREPRAATVKCVADMTCLRLEREAFQLLLGPLEEAMQNQLSGYEQKQSATPKDVQKCDIKFEDLETIATLGQGSFGHVRLMRDKKTKDTYALKAVSKQQIVETQQQSHILDEKRVMIRLQHPFCVRLFTTFKDKNLLYFLLEPALGGELYTILRRKKTFPNAVSRFYLGQVILAFQYLHDKNYIYRDLKPENLLIGSDGYLKVTDFGFAKEVTGTTWTLCGTPEYLCPEIVSGKGHGKGVDWWTVGILLYEMLASYTPFVHEDQLKMYDRIVRGNLRFPSSFSSEAKDLITRFLTHKPTSRLGVIKGGANLIKKHPYFDGMNWEELGNKKLPAPHIPKIKNPTDVSNFQCNEKFKVIPYKDDGTNWDEDF